VFDLIFIKCELLSFALDEIVIEEAVEIVRVVAKERFWEAMMFLLDANVDVDSGSRHKSNKARLWNSRPLTAGLLTQSAPERKVSLERWLVP